MKKFCHINCVFFLCFLVGCTYESEQVIRYSLNEPVFMPTDEFRSSVKIISEPRALEECGKICFYNNYLYISQPGKGIYIIDNTNPSNPQSVGFIELLGNYDMTVYDGRLYADAFIDLVWFDVSNPAQPVLQGRLEDAFQGILPPIENSYGLDYAMCADKDSKDVIVGWTVKEHVETIKETHSWWDWNNKEILYESSVASPSGNGVTGSMSRFGLYNNYLYTVVNDLMSVFDLSETTPQPKGETTSVWEVETIFTYNDKLFLGTSLGMQIYSLENPLHPTFRSSVSHVYGCDPVVVDDTLAYVTIFSNNICMQNNNVLIVFNVSDIDCPKEIVSYQMTCPKGLGVDKGMLFLCDDGLKIFKTGDPQVLIANQIKHYRGWDGFDLIPFDGVLMLISDKGLYQYDYSNPLDIRELSFLPITNQ